MAEGFANKYGRDVLVALSAGLTPTRKTPIETIDVMSERGVDIRDHVPQLYDPREAAECEVVVNLSGVKLVGVPGKRVVDWKVTDPFGQPIDVYRQVRDELEARVMKLILDLRTQAAKAALAK